MLAAKPQLDVGVALAAAAGGDEQELADPFEVERVERILGEDRRD